MTDSTQGSSVDKPMDNDEEGTAYPLVPVQDISYSSFHLTSGVLRRAIDAEHAIYWLSSLGGAFSNLGDHSKDWAIKAGDNALEQMRIISMFEDPSSISKCHLFLAMSYIQRGELGKAQYILRTVYKSTKKSKNPDEKILTMARGIWSKLSYAVLTTRGSQMKQIK